jgi:arylsulfatase A-like enzyme
MADRIVSHARQDRSQAGESGPRATSGTARLAKTLALGIAVAAGLFAAPTTAAQARPNVLLIVTDDQRAAGTMGIMRETRRVFGRGGVRFTRAHATTPWCCPSRASIFSGLYAHNHDVATNDGTMFDADRTWQRRLSRAGYRTGIAGRYLNQVPTASAQHFDFRRSIARDEQREPRLLHRYVRKFLSASERRDPRPWALVLAPHSPHAPWGVKPEERCRAERFEPGAGNGESDLSDKHPAVRAEARRQAGRPVERIHRGQLCELQAVDEAVGRIFDHLGRLGEDRRTLAIFTSDNGFQWGEHGLFKKTWPYRESTHVPLYMSWPGHVGRGRVDTRLAANIDIAPTIFAATGIRARYAVDGRSLLSGARRSDLLLELPAGSDRSPAWSARLTARRLYVEWADGFVESYGADDPAQLDADNTASAEAAAWLSNARRCSGAECP